MHTLSRQHRAAAALAGLSLAGGLVLTGCSAGGGTASSGDRAAAAAPREGAQGKPGAGAAAAPAAPDAKGQPQAPVRPNVIRTGKLGIETAEPQKVIAAARTAAEGAGGYVGAETTDRGDDGRITSTLTLRVPGDRFDAVIASLEGSGKLLNRKVEAQDVTEKVADVDSRVKSQQASVARVREMMEKASALSDVVMLESELSRRQSDLESLLAQQNALKDQTSMGTLTVSVSQPDPAPVEKEKKEREPGMGDALAGGWKVFARLVGYLGLALAAVLPFALAAALPAFGFRLYRRLRPAKPKTGLRRTLVPRQAAAPVPDPAADGRDGED
ncbi:uncharacterized protein DUF4349 [Streptomyces sp. 3211.6]|uniref:DUF4349 domain-containing protein n=1 Tax=unclassified Streptomyces TaxID=2593676 RepID=UPI000C2C29E6|nr:MULTISPECIES: DUF4349 domain-containing protein [unclassified Streptomyces]RKT07493.1 uncharacterized protein DUF4349 [Streptomyces sp. 3211.6]RPF44887.1 uncharacterized protein DUF4349 [Streptomyces sp. Ag109_G2-6]